MRSTIHKLLTCTLLAAYAGIALIGDGLHALTPGHEHHHGLCVVTCTEHDHDHDAPGHDDHEHEPAGPIVSATDGACDSHNCEICEFLIQAVSQPPQLVATPELHPLVAELTCHEQELYSPAIVGLHAARGPPQLHA